MENDQMRLLGFRSGKPLKKIAAVLYYALCVAVLVLAMVTPVPVSAGARDQFIYRLSGVIIFVWMMSPAIFLSETPLRRWLPFFKKKNFMGSLGGMMIVFLFFAYLFAAVGELYTPEFNGAFGAYIQSTYESFIEAGIRGI